MMETDSGNVCNFPRRLHFISVFLSVTERDCADFIKMAESPEQAGRRILTPAQDDQSLVSFHYISKTLKGLYDKCINNNINIEGIFTHIYNASNETDYNKQIEFFENLLKEIDISKVPIIHISASEALTNYIKPKEANGCRLGIIMYGFSEKINLESPVKLISEVIQIHNLKKGEVVGYNGIFKAEEDTKIGVIPMGYADGIIRKNTGRYVYINNNKYKIVGNVCMDMLFVEINENVHLYDTVELLKDNKHIEETAKYLETIPYEILCEIGERVPRIYKNK